jgi:hypothetical protein
LKTFQGRNAAQEFCCDEHRVAQHNEEAREETRRREFIRKTPGGRTGQVPNRQLSDMPDGNFR